MSDNYTTYDLVVLDDVEIDNSGGYNNQDLLESLAYNTSKLLIPAGDLTSSNPQNREIIGVNYTDRSGCGSFPNITITNPDPFLIFNYGEILEPQECHYVNKTTTSELTAIGKYYKKSPGAKLEQPAIAKWYYGNSTIYYFSHFDAKYLGSDDNYQNEIKRAIKTYLGDCFVVINLDMGNAKNRVVITRLIRYQNQMIKMVLYLWERN